MSTTESVYQGRMFEVIRKRIAGDDGRERVREIILHPGAVVILPVLDDGRIVLIANQRDAVEERLLELPAGTLEPAEDPCDAARRELAEETGYRAASLRKLTEFYSSPGILRERMHLYVAEGLTAGPTALEHGEDIETLVVTQDAALAMARDGRIRDAKTLVGLLWYDTLDKR